MGPDLEIKALAMGRVKGALSIDPNPILWPRTGLTQDRVVPALAQDRAVPALVPGPGHGECGWVACLGHLRMSVHTK